MTNALNKAQLSLRSPPLPPLLAFFLDSSISSAELHPAAKPSCAISRSCCMT